MRLQAQVGRHRLGDACAVSTMSGDKPSHLPVLLHETMALLDVRKGGSYIDCTAGAGGHLSAIAHATGQTGRVLGLDRDADALALCHARFDRVAPWVTLRHGNFQALEQLANEYAPIDGILFDIGVSSMQIDQSERGFSFQQDGPLDMRMDRSTAWTAADIVNTASVAELASMISNFGEERFALRVARAIVTHRRATRLETTHDLANVVRLALGRGRELIDPATRTFQALRIAVNGELVALDRALSQAIMMVRPGGRVVVISFHSLEDRIVKRAFLHATGQCVCPSGLAVCGCGADDRRVVRVLTRRPISATAAEVAANPRSRSARLRAVEAFS